MNADSNYYEFALDSSPPYAGKTWLLGGPTWDPQAPTAGVCYELGSIGFPAYWLLRANAE